VAIGHDQPGHYRRERGEFVTPDDPELSGVGSPPLVSVPDGDGDPLVGEPGPGEGEPDSLGEPDSDGDPDSGEPEPDCGELDCGGGLPDCPVGGGGDCGGWLRKIKMAINTASAASKIISSQETKIVRHPARSKRPGQGSGHNRVSPGFTLSIQ
jgi:hypothetical protein